jgi:long-chain acyl-CoA synthetase
MVQWLASGETPTGASGVPSLRVTRADPRETNSISGLLIHSATHHGSRTALQVLRRGAWLRLSYRDLVSQARARALTLGLAPGARVLLVAETSPEWGIAYFSAIFAGATVVPVDPQLSIADMQTIASRTSAQVWLVSRSVAARLREETPTVSSVLEIDDWLDQPLQAHGESVAPRGREGASDPASIPFTSGTTLAPKGVPLTHANFLANARALLQVISVDARDQFLCVLPLHHILAFTGSFLAPLSVGATVTFPEKLTPRALAEAMQGSRTTVLIAVPRLYALLVRSIRSRLEGASRPTRALFVLLTLKARFLRGMAIAVPPLAPALRAVRALLFRSIHRGFGGKIRYLVSGGAALPRQYYDALDLLGFRVLEGYGLTEASPVLALTPPDHPRRGSVGPPLPGIELRIAEPDEEGVGEVWARGASVFAGYLDDEEATREAFADGWFRTGDLGSLDRTGHLHLAGRADDVIVTGGGKNVYPLELEWLYQGLPHVREFCVIGLPDRGSAGDAPHGVFVLEAPPEGAADETLRHAVEAAVSARARGLPSHQRLRGVHFWESDLPRTSTLKLKRRQLRAALVDACEGVPARR